MDDKPARDAGDPIDVLVRSVPKGLWVAIIVATIMLVASWLLFEPPSPARTGEEQDGTGETIEGRVVELLSEEEMLIAEQPQQVQRALVEITRGSQAGRRFEVVQGRDTVLNEGTRVRVGDRVLLQYDATPDRELVYITDFVRYPGLLGLTLLFTLAAVAVGRWVGVRALVSMGISVLAIAGFIVPGIMSGHDPLLICMIGSLFLMTASLYLVYGWTWKTHAAMAGLAVSLVVTALLAVFFGDLGRLTGLGSEEAGFLVHLGGVPINLRGVLLGGIVVGAVGVIDDVAVGQASSTVELRRANPSLGWLQLYQHSMAIGRDHIASMTNTLLLAYVGASLPLFLLLASLNIPLAQTLNREFIAEEIVRTLVGSLGLILAVPVTSLVAALVAQKYDTEVIQ